MNVPVTPITYKYCFGISAYEKLPQCSVIFMAYHARARARRQQWSTKVNNNDNCNRNNRHQQTNSDDKMLTKHRNATGNSVNPTQGH